jgi:hypothetical protein
MTRITGTFHEDLWTIWQYLAPRMRKVSEKICGDNQNIYFTFKDLFLRKSWLLWDAVKKCGRSRQATIWRMRFECRVTKRYRRTLVIRNTLLLTRQQWLSERNSVLIYTYIASLVLWCLNISSSVYFLLSALQPHWISRRLIGYFSSLLYVLKKKNYK